MSDTTSKPAKGFVDGAVRSQHDEAVASSVARDAYKRERYEFLLRTIFATLGLLAVSMVLNVWLATRPVLTRYFAVSPEGGITEVVPLERPVQSTGEVLNWATESVTKAFTLSFANYQQQLNEDRLNFTDGGWVGFQDALKGHKFLDTVITQQLVTSVVPTGAPVILSQGIVDGNRYGWRMQIPLLITLESASGRSNQSMTIEAVVTRRPEAENPRGLGIAQLITR